MSTDAEKLERLRRFNAFIQREDPELRFETADVVGGEVMELTAAPERIETAIEQESIVLKRERPVLRIVDNATVLEFQDTADSAIWKRRLSDAAPILGPAIRAVGRVELRNGSLDWVGTGWLVHDSILVTNRHVAEEFAIRRGHGFVFKPGIAGPLEASIDFLEEIDNPRELVFRLMKPLYIQSEPGPDIAFFEVDAGSGSGLAGPIALCRNPSRTEDAATIGYPAYDSRIPDVDLMERIYGRIYNKKRLAPGGVTGVEQVHVVHNCTTLGGNSGSAVIDLRTGEALGLHFSGSFLRANYAVRADVVARLLAQVRSGRVRPEAPSRSDPLPATPARMNVRAGTASLQIPLTISVSVGTPFASEPSRRPAMPPGGDAQADSAEIDETEARVEDYADRDGYQSDFLGARSEVDLPKLTRNERDVVPVGSDADGVLRYTHFSVVMSRSRRVCFFSACNIDGNLSRKTKRVGWKWDPRLPKSQQIMYECYGNPPKFSRGHMTRREDPGWGTAAEAKRGNEDSMHVTNATPQMQAFNSPIWLGLEDYALDHAREDDMKISVFTGPYLTAQDPVMHEVPIPKAFWKIIAFIHDDTGELCATGYEMNQESTLQPEEEFVFGQYTSPRLGIATQVPIRSIESRAGISFGGLADVDPLDGRESVAASGLQPPLGSLEQIRFLR